MDVRIDGVRYVATSPYQWNGCFTLGAILREHRELSRLSLDHAALQSDISKTYLWELETGAANDPSFAIVVRLARLYGISLDVLAAVVK